MNAQTATLRADVVRASAAHLIDEGYPVDTVAQRCRQEFYEANPDETWTPEWQREAADRVAQHLPKWSVSRNEFQRIKRQYAQIHVAAAAHSCGLVASLVVRRDTMFAGYTYPTNAQFGERQLGVMAWVFAPADRADIQESRPFRGDGWESLTPEQVERLLKRMKVEEGIARNERVSMATEYIEREREYERQYVKDLGSTNYKSDEGGHGLVCGVCGEDDLGPGPCWECGNPNPGYRSNSGLEIRAQMLGCSADDLSAAINATRTVTIGDRVFPAMSKGI